MPSLVFAALDALLFVLTTILTLGGERFYFTSPATIRQPLKVTSYTLYL
jgi:hypothetical protein